MNNKDFNCTLQLSYCTWKRRWRRKRVRRRWSRQRRHRCCRSRACADCRNRPVCVSNPMQCNHRKEKEIKKKIPQRKWEPLAFDFDSKRNAIRTRHETGGRVSDAYTVSRIGLYIILLPLYIYIKSEHSERLREQLVVHVLSFFLSFYAPGPWALGCINFPLRSTHSHVSGNNHEPASCSSERPTHTHYKK